MDSPPTTTDKPPTTTTNATATATGAAASSNCIAVHDSPIFSYISNLSPIKPVKAAPVAQGFPGLNSPPLVFTSPRINPQQKRSFLKRLQCPQSSSVDISRLDQRDKTIVAGAADSRNPDRDLSSRLDPYTEKEDLSYNSAHDQADSSPGCVDGYLAELLEDCADSSHSANLSLKHFGDVSQSLDSLMDSKESLMKLGNEDKAGNEVVTAGENPTTLEQAEEDCKGKLSFDVKAIETDGEQGGGDMPSSFCSKLENQLPVDHAFDEKQCEHPVSEIGQDYQDCLEETEAVWSEPVQKMTLLDPKVIQQRQYGMRRRCLQFEDAQQKSTRNRPGSWNPSNSASSSQSPASPADSEVLESSGVDISAPSSDRQLTNMGQPIVSICSPRISGKSISTISKPSGIGLHLNSIINVMPVGCGATASMKSAERGSLNVRGNNTISVSARSEDVKIAASSVTSSSPVVMKSLYTPVLLKSSEKSNFEHVDDFDESIQSSPKKKRKKSSGLSDGDGCRRCNCKKTKCLKLYCDCFAAGIYCAEPCACQGCFNRPEYEDTVLETRQQIESRNPLAFVPKIVKRVNETPAVINVDHQNQFTPSSARHKRGCNCKKSMCLKKYCECYQANVGCSDGCRCEGCKNGYGRKGEHGMNEENVMKEVIGERSEGSFNEKIDMVATANSFLEVELCNPHNMTPPTPSFQCSDSEKGVSRSWLPSGRYLPSPESDLTFLASYGKSTGSSINSNRDMNLETGKQILSGVSFDQELDYGSAERVDEFSPSFTALPIPPSLAKPALTSPRARNWMNDSTTQLCPESSRYSSASSLRWRSSPITPVTLFEGPKLHQMIDSNDNLYNIMEDDTPEILKDTSRPPNAVKISSPNKKRVSPPQSCLHELDSSSSAGLRSGRKFILKAVPSFPPLTPCIDIRSNTGQKTEELKNCRSSNRPT